MIPDGWKLVPIKPTADMLVAGLMERDVSGSGDRGLPLVYTAMLSASPPSPVGEEMWNAIGPSFFNNIEMNNRDTPLGSLAMHQHYVAALKRQSGEG